MKKVQPFLPYFISFVLFGVLISLAGTMPRLLKYYAFMTNDGISPWPILASQILGMGLEFAFTHGVICLGAFPLFRRYFTDQEPIWLFLAKVLICHIVLRYLAVLAFNLLVLGLMKLLGQNSNWGFEYIFTLPYVVKSIAYSAVLASLHTVLMLAILKRRKDWGARSHAQEAFD